MDSQDWKLVNDHMTHVENYSAFIVSNINGVGGRLVQFTFEK